MSEQTASSIRYQQALVSLAQRRLRGRPLQQAEAIAKHYAAHATLAINLLHLIEAQREAAQQDSGTPAAIDAAANAYIAYHVEEIKRNHLHDFGIELEWL